MAAVQYPGKSRRAALFMSGGIDSLSALRINRKMYPETHPGFIKDCLLVHGFDIGGVVERGMKYPVFERAKQAMAAVAAAFLARYLEDVEAGRVRDESAYAALFPGYEDLIAAELAALAQADADERWRYYSQLADVQRSIPHLEHEPAAASADAPGASTNGKGESK